MRPLNLSLLFFFLFVFSSVAQAKELTAVDFVDEPNYYQASNFYGCIRVYKDTAGYDAIYNQDCKDLRVYYHRWQAEYWRTSGGGSWRSIGVPVSTTYAEFEDSVVISRSYTDYIAVDYTVDYTISKFAPLKVSVSFTNAGAERVFRLNNQLDGVVGNNFTVSGNKAVFNQTIGAFTYSWDDVYQQFGNKTEILNSTGANGRKIDLYYGNWTIPTGGTLELDPTVDSLPYTISDNNTVYNMTANLSSGSSPLVLFNGVQNDTLDCFGYKLTYTGTGGGNNIAVTNGVNNTIQGCYLEATAARDTATGGRIRALNSLNTTIYNNTFISQGNNGGAGSAGSTGTAGNNGTDSHGAGDAGDGETGGVGGAGGAGTSGGNIYLIILSNSNFTNVSTNKFGAITPGNGGNGGNGGTGGKGGYGGHGYCRSVPYLTYQPGYGGTGGVGGAGGAGGDGGGFYFAYLDSTSQNNTFEHTIVPTVTSGTPGNGGNGGAGGSGSNAGFVCNADGTYCNYPNGCASGDFCKTTGDGQYNPSLTGGGNGGAGGAQGNAGSSVTIYGIYSATTTVANTVINNVTFTGLTTASAGSVGSAGSGGAKGCGPTWSEYPASACDRGSCDANGTVGSSGGAGSAGSRGSVYAITLSKYAYVSNLIISAMSATARYALYGSSFYGKIVNSNLTIASSPQYDLYVDAASYPTLLNTSFSHSRVSFAGAGNYTTSWWVRVKTQFASGAAIEGATANGTNVNDSQVFSNTTLVTGYTDYQEVPEVWKNSSTTVNYTPHYFNVTKNGYTSNSTTQAITGNTDVVLDMDTVDNVTFVLTTPADGNLTNNQNVSFNFTPTASYDAIVNCSLFSNKTGSWALSQDNQSTVTNVTPVIISYNFTQDGDFLWGARCYNNRSNDFWSDNRSISIDATSPKTFTVVSPTQPDGQVISFNWVYVNMTFNETHNDSCWIQFSNGSVDNYTATVVVNSSGDTQNVYLNLTSQPDGVNITYLVWCNDTHGNLAASANRSIYVNSNYPSVSLVTPAYGTSTTATALNFTFTPISSGTLANATLYHNCNGSSWGDKSVNTSAVANNSLNGIYFSPLAVSVCEWNFYVCDSVGRCSFASANNTLSITAPIVGGGGGGGGIGGDKNVLLFSPSNFVLNETQTGRTITLQVLFKEMEGSKKTVQLQSNTSFIQLNEKEFVLDAYESKNVSFLVRVPFVLGTYDGAVNVLAEGKPVGLISIIVQPQQQSEFSLFFGDLNLNFPFLSEVYGGYPGALWLLGGLLSVALISGVTVVRSKRRGGGSASTILLVSGVLAITTFLLYGDLITPYIPSVPNVDLGVFLD